MKRFLVILTVLCSLVLPALAEWNVPIFRQDLGEWLDDPLGTCPLSVTNFGAEGCAVTSVASIFSFYSATIDGQPVDPGNLNQSLTSHNCYSSGGCWGGACHCILIWTKATNALDPAHGIIHKQSINGNAASLVALDAALLTGPVVIKKSFGSGVHFLVATGTLPNGTYSVMDPLGIQDTISPNEIIGVRVYKCPGFDPPLFLDVEDKHWAWEYISEMKSREIMNGQNGMFYPENNISRGEICTMIVRANSLPWNSSYSNPFTDIDENNSHYRSILICYHLGYVSGVGNQFYPDNPVLRRDASKMICNGFEISLWNTLLNIWRDYSIGDDNYEYAYTLCREGILSGYPDHNFGPNNNLTRAEAAKIFSNVLALE